MPCWLWLETWPRGTQQFSCCISDACSTVSVVYPGSSPNRTFSVSPALETSPSSQTKWSGLQMWQRSPPYNLLDSDSNPDLNLSLFIAPGDSWWPQISKESQIHSPWALHFGAVSPKSLYYPSPSVSFRPSEVMQPTPVPDENYLNELHILSPYFTHLPPLNLLMTQIYMFFLTWVMILTPTSASVPLFSPCLILILTKTLAQVIKMEAIYNLP